MSRDDDNHHLWRNGRLWWVAFVALADGVRQVRIRQSLKTDDVEVARARRDALIEEYMQRVGWVVPLRMPSRREEEAGSEADGSAAVPPVDTSSSDSRRASLS